MDPVAFCARGRAPGPPGAVPDTVQFQLKPSKVQSGMQSRSPAPAQAAPVAAAPADAHPAPLELDRFLPYRLSVLSNRVSQAVATLYSQKFGLAINEWRVIAVLGRYPGLSANGVAERTAMDKVAVSRAVAGLLGRGLLQREMHENDRRRSVLALSATGHEVYDEIVPLAQGFERDLVSALDAGERAQLDLLMDKLGKRFGL